MPAIYHFTDADNIPGILADGELRAHISANCIVDVADSSIKSRRTLIRVPCGARGRVCDYVPFYFAPRSPMLFRIQRGGVEGVSSDQRRIVYLRTSVEAVVSAGLPYVFTDGNAVGAITSFHDDADRLQEVVDWPLMTVRYWRNTPEDGDRVRRRQAEFLVHQAVPLTLVEELGVYDAGAETSVCAMRDAAGSSLTVRIRSQWYF